MKSSTLHIGCGMEKYTGAIGIDINPRSQADIIHDLNVFPYPFKANSFDCIIAENIIEHFYDIVGVMEELHRIAKPNAVIRITTGHYSSTDAFTDPTHHHFFSSRSFDYFIPGTDLYKYRYSDRTFKKRSVRLGPSSVSNILLKWLLAVINAHAVFYESRFAFIFPVGVIAYELEVIKMKRNPKKNPSLKSHSSPK